MDMHTLFPLHLSSFFFFFLSLLYLLGYFKLNIHTHHIHTTRTQHISNTQHKHLLSSKSSYIQYTAHTHPTLIPHSPYTRSAEYWIHAHLAFFHMNIFLLGFLLTLILTLLLLGIGSSIDSNPSEPSPSNSVRPWVRFFRRSLPKSIYLYLFSDWLCTHSWKQCSVSSVGAILQ